jgi:CubicO group peptidase (beta-lactamase class C family)
MITEIDEIIQAQFDEQGPGVAVAVVKDGEVIHCKGYGLANLEWNCAVAPESGARRHLPAQSC